MYLRNQGVCAEVYYYKRGFVWLPEECVTRFENIGIFQNFNRGLATLPSWLRVSLKAPLYTAEDTINLLLIKFNLYIYVYVFYTVCRIDSDNADVGWILTSKSTEE